mmetsp:Transcript_9499/g.24396  ORF Transcript_9499/g.24396 Transcript_9499/m.24396 type:complete len:225 (+) Transcript_9499:290-964(+)
MKFLEYTPLEKLKSFLDSADVGDYMVEGVLEAYSCKAAGVDKKLSRSLDQEVGVSSVSPTSSGALSVSPTGPLTESGSRKTLIHLILTLNHIYPDYDFTLLRAHNFSKESGIEAVKTNVDTLLIEASKLWQEEHGTEQKTLSDTLWTVMEEVISVYDCDIYSYNPEYESDPFGEEGHIWAFNYFFYNKKMKRVLYFSCKARSKLVQDKSYEDVDEDRVFGEMDL